MDITIATMVRPFEGEFREIQRTCLLNWIELSDDVILVGDAEKDAAKFASDFECKLVPCQRNSEGVKLVGSAIDAIMCNAENKWVLFTGAETLYDDSVIAAVEAVDAAFPAGRSILVVGQRIDVAKDGNLTVHPGYCIEYFLFRGDPWGTLPEFAAGRPGYDNCLVWKALDNEMPVVDATGVILARHLEHGSRHRTGKLADRNRKTMRKECGYAEIRHATYTLRSIEEGVVEK